MIDAKPEIHAHSVWCKSCVSFYLSKRKRSETNNCIYVAFNKLQNQRYFLFFLIIYFQEKTQLFVFPKFLLESCLFFINYFFVEILIVTLVVSVHIVKAFCKVRLKRIKTFPYLNFLKQHDEEKF